MTDITRDCSKALQKGIRDAKVWGWSYLHVMRAETTYGVSYGIGTVLFGASYQIHFSRGIA